MTARVIKNSFSLNYSKTSEQDYIPVPLTYGTSWESTRIDTMDWGEFGTNISVITSENSIDAYGTMKLPVGDFDCLRWRSINTKVSNSTDTTTYIEYTRVAKENILVAKVNSQIDEADTNFTNAMNVELFSTIITSTKNKLVQTHYPQKYSLSQNYPNPFSSRNGFSTNTKITFDIPEF